MEPGQRVRWIASAFLGQTGTVKAVGEMPDGTPFVEIQNDPQPTSDEQGSNTTWRAHANDIESLQEGGIVTETNGNGVPAVVHPNEAVIPLDSPEGQEALADAVSDAAESVIENAVEVVAKAQEVAEEVAEEVVAEEVHAAVNDAFNGELANLERLVVDTIERTVPRVLALLGATQGAGNGTENVEEIAAEVAEEVAAEAVPDVAPEREHWFYRPIGSRNA